MTASKKAVQLHGRFQARCSGAGYGAVTRFQKRPGVWTLSQLVGAGGGSLQEEASGVRLSGDEREELKRLRKEVRNCGSENQILKKASQFFRRK